MRQLIGNQLVEALRLEHREMLEQLERIDSSLVNTDALGLIVNEEQLVKEVDSLCQFVSEHSLKEDTMLQLLRKLESQS